MFKWNEKLSGRTCTERWWAYHDVSLRPFVNMTLNDHEFMRELIYGSDMTSYYYATFRNLSYWTWVSYV